MVPASVHQGSCRSHRHGAGAGGLGFVGTTEITVVGARIVAWRPWRRHWLSSAAHSNMSEKLCASISGTGLRQAPELARSVRADLAELAPAVEPTTLRRDFRQW